MNFIDDCNMLRDGVRQLGELIAGLQKHDVFGGIMPARSNPGEMHANIQLAYRHLEDARMRLGKAIQAFEGVDIFDVPQVKEAIQEQRHD